MSYRDQLLKMPSLSLLAMNDTPSDSLCWKCSAAQGFYSSPCERCGAINPNFDLDSALAQQQSAHTQEAKP